MKYTYCFCVWPDEFQPWNRAVFDYFRVYQQMVEMELTEGEFTTFREAMEADGFTLREISRWPHHEPETVL